MDHILKTSVQLLLCLVVFNFLHGTNAISFRHMFIEPTAEGIASVSNLQREETLEDYQTRVVNGQEAVRLSLPYQAYLVFNGTSSRWLCGGSLISTQYVITAAHCGDGATSVLVYLGGHELSQNESQRLRIVATDIKIFEDYDAGRIHHDIGVIKLPEPITFTQAIQPIRLPSRLHEETTFADFEVTVSGFGKVDGFATSSVTTLQTTSLTVIENERCGAYFSNVVDDIICTSGEEFKGVCSGDSGGPLVWNGVLVGVVSYGVVYCLPGYPSGYARVTSFLDWIQNNTDVTVY